MVWDIGEETALLVEETKEIELFLASEIVPVRRKSIHWFNRIFCSLSLYVSFLSGEGTWYLDLHKCLIFLGSAEADESYAWAV